jgi:outer membrane protein
MKKMLMLAAALITTSGNFVQAGDLKKLVSIDSISIMQKSIEGKEITSKIQKDIEAFQEEVKTTQKDLSDFQESLMKQAKVLSAEAMQEKSAELNNKRKKLEREFAEKEEALRADIQKKQLALRERQQSVINEVFKQEKWSLLIDKNTPGVLCVAETIDQTPLVLQAVDSKYQEGKAKKTAPKAATVKTAAADQAPATSKQTIKVA